MPFNFNGRAELVDLRPHRGKSDDAEVQLDMKFKAVDVSAEAAAAVLGADDGASVVAGLFRSVAVDADQNTAFPSIKGIQADCNFENRHAITVAGLRRVRCARVGKISIKPRAKGLSDMTFSVTVEAPPQNFVELLAEHLNEVIKVNLEQEAELPLEGGQNGAIPDHGAKQRAASLRAKDILPKRNKTSRKPTKKAKRKAA